MSVHYVISHTDCTGAGFRECCNPDVTSTCQVQVESSNGSIASCYCDRMCFQFGDCCEDILDVPCFPCK